MTENTRLIKISKEYKDYSGTIWMGTEVTSNATTLEEYIADCRKEEDWMDAYVNSKSQPHTPTDVYQGLRTEKIPEERRVGLVAADILSSPDLTTLESYKLLVKNKPELQEAYDKRLKQLQNQ